MLTDGTRLPIGWKRRLRYVPAFWAALRQARSLTARGAYTACAR